MSDRANLARQRQHMRAKTASVASSTSSATKPKKKITKPRRQPLHTETQPTAATIGSTKKTNGTRKSSAAAAPVSALGSANMALVVRQILQRKHCGDDGEYVGKTSKAELFRQLTQVAQYAYETREQQQADQTSTEEEIQRMEQRVHELVGRLIDAETQQQTSEAEREQLNQRLQISNGEYSNVVDTLRKYDAKWGETQTTMAQQQQLLQEMSRSLDERTAHVNVLNEENASMKAALMEAQTEITGCKNQLQVLQIESARSQQQLADERRENKAVLWELQNKTRDYDDVSDQLDNAKEHLLTLEGQIQMELIARKSLVQERDAAQLLHRRQHEEWKNAETARGEADYRRAQEYRNMDLELRQLRQAIGRLRIDLETERTHCEKAETTALKATDIADVRTKELKATGKSLHSDVQTLTTQLQEERAVRESKENALTIAYRDVQSLQKRIRDEESARQDAQNEVEALMHRMKLIRRDHLTMLHRVETPPQLLARWREPGVHHP